MKKKLLISSLLILLGALILGLLKTCAYKPVSTNIDHLRDSLKAEIRKELKSKDSVKKEIVYKDSVRKVIIYRYRSDKEKSKTAPCDSILPIIIADTDTIIKVDSSLIYSMKRELLIDSIVISDQSKIIKADSAEIRTLKKKVKRKTFLNKVLGAGFVGALIYGIAK